VAEAATAPVRAGRSRRPIRRAALLAAVGLPLAGVATVAVLMLASGGGREAAAAPSTPLAAGDVRAVADAFAQAYETEDGAALRRLLTSDVQRVLPDGDVHGRAAVAAQYEAQFRDNATQSYDLEDVVVSGGRTGRASAAYRVRRAGGPSLRGRIVLGIVRDRGASRIALIAVTPSA
jgi:ketosteroid isomerase-like protein